jgi:hypothetical protein
MTGAPLVVLGVFTLTEALGLMPNILRKTAFQSDQIGNLQYKYVLLALLLIGLSVYHRLKKPALRPGVATA